jgi:steroid 5-alpha reductase family enzyme
MFLSRGDDMTFTIGFLLLYFHLVYCWALWKKDLSVIDVAWGPGFVVVWLSYHMKSLEMASLILIAQGVMVFLWALRLSLYLGKRNHLLGEDPRYTEMKKRWSGNPYVKAYVKVFGIQATAMLIISLPLFLIKVESFGLFQLIGLLLWLFGFVFEAVADAQKGRFKNHHQAKKNVCQTGLWRLSRYANYFGEACVWWGLYLFSVTSFKESSTYVMLLSPLLLTFLLLKISGIPPIERRRQQLYASDADYQAYVKRTNLFIPWFPSHRE